MLYYGLGIVFMLGGAVVAYVKALQGGIGKQEKELVDYRLYAAEPRIEGIPGRVEARNS